MRYQWRFNGAAVAGATDNVFSIQRVRLEDQGRFSAVVSNDQGSVTSRDATLTVRGLDFGDAPEPYPTKRDAGGAAHRAAPGFQLGERIDSDQDGQPSPNATGDDLNPSNADDEDGVTFSGPLAPGQTAQITVVASADGRLDAWVDFNGDGDWEDATDQIFLAFPLKAGPNSLTFAIPQDIKNPVSYARFRFSKEGGLKPAGAAEEGEVEDYAVTFGGNLDFGDAPPPYPTTLKDNGARHVIDQKLRLGLLEDSEADGQPHPDAKGDDSNPPGVAPDEDGVKFLDPLRPGQTVKIEVSASDRCRLDAWADFNADGDWLDGGEQIFASVQLGATINTLSFQTPSNAPPGKVFFRFRASRQGGLKPDGLAPDGEVEDYVAEIEGAFDFSDAPDRPYPTLLSNNGARHLIVPNFHLGRRIDGEPDGQPNGPASGDDISPTPDLDDEDGVRFLTPLTPGQTSVVEVVVTMPSAPQAARLDAWLDFSGDGDWADASEQIFSGQPVGPGANILSFFVPTAARQGPTYARFRLTRQGIKTFDGPAPDGEVEDYLVRVSEQPPPERCDLSCTGTNFWLTFPGNYAPDPARPHLLQLCIVGLPETIGGVSIPALGFAQAFIIPGSGAVTIDLPDDADLGDVLDTVENKGIFVFALRPVGVYGLNHVRFTTDSYLGLSTETLGTEYIVQSFKNVHTGAPDLNGTQFAIVGCETNTTVTIVPSANVASHPAGVAFSIQLNAGQTYQLRGATDSPTDLSGTIISSDKPIAVFGGHACANVRSSDPFFCDYLVEQLLPVKAWGRNFLTAPLATRTGGDTFRVLAAENGTQVSVNGSVVATINRGQTFETALTTASRIDANRPVFVTQYANSSDFDGQRISDPFMTTVAATPMFERDHRFCAPTNDFPTNFVNVIAPAAAVGLVQLDGVAIPAGQFAPIGASGFSFARRLVAPGIHRVQSPQPVGVTIYGWAEYDSYGHPGCLFMGDTTPPVLTCPPDIIVTAGAAGTPAPTPCSAPVPNLIEQIRVSDACSPNSRFVVEQDPEPGTFLPVGVHEIVLSTADARGNVGTCAVRFEILPGPNAPFVINCPKEVRAQCIDQEPVQVFFDVTAGAACGTQTSTNLTCEPPSGSFFPPGTTVVTCVARSPTGAEVRCEFPVIVECGTTPPTITISPIDPAGFVRIRLLVGGVFETTDDLGKSWAPVDTTGQPPGEFVVRPSGTTRFYRIRPVN